MYIGIDLGGTNMAVGLVDEKGDIVLKKSAPTRKNGLWNEIVYDMAKLTMQTVEEAGYVMNDVKAVGIGCPGSIDHAHGVVMYANNIKFENAPVAEEFRKYIDLPVNLENDANAAAYGEYVKCGEGAESLVFVTLGTGVGGGIVLDGKIYRGFNGAGAEIGHMVICKDGEKCTCGRLGCWEAYASATALVRQTKKKMEECKESKMHDIAKKYGEVNGRVAFEAAKMGDSAAIEVRDEYINYIGIGLANIVNIFQPERVLIGGGISKEGDALIAPLKDFMMKNDYNRFMEKTRIETAKLFNDAGIIGAAMAAMR